VLALLVLLLVLLDLRGGRLSIIVACVFHAELSVLLVLTSASLLAPEASCRVDIAGITATSLSAHVQAIVVVHPITFPPFAAGAQSHCLRAKMRELKVAARRVVFVRLTR